jgi:hypothetical protein
MEDEKLPTSFQPEVTSPIPDPFKKDGDKVSDFPRPEIDIPQLNFIADEDISMGKKHLSSPSSPMKNPAPSSSLSPQIRQLPREIFGDTVDSSPIARVPPEAIVDQNKPSSPAITNPINSKDKMEACRVAWNNAHSSPQNPAQWGIAVGDRPENVAIEQNPPLQIPGMVTQLFFFKYENLDSQNV